MSLNLGEDSRKTEAVFSISFPVRDDLLFVSAVLSLFFNLSKFLDPVFYWKLLKHKSGGYFSVVGEYLCCYLYWFRYYIFRVDVFEVILFRKILIENEGFRDPWNAWRALLSLIIYANNPWVHKLLINVKVSELLYFIYNLQNCFNSWLTPSQLLYVSGKIF